MKLRYFTVALCALLVVSCGDKRGEPVTPDPTPLNPIKRQIVLDQLWSVGNRDKPKISLFSLIPAVVNGVVYHAALNGSISALQADTGAPIWAVNLNRPIASGVGASDEMLAVVTDGGTLIALSTESGAIQWEVETSRAILAPPLIYSGDVFVRTIDGSLLSYSGKDGGEFWQAKFDQPNFLVSGEPQPVAAGNYLVLGNAGNQLFGFDAAAGFVSWQIRVGERRQGAASGSGANRVNLVPQANNNIVYVAVPPTSLVGYDTLTGQSLWTATIATENQLDIDVTAVYGFDGEGQVFALDRINGGNLWKLTDLMHRGITDIHVVNRNVVVADRQGYLHLINSTSGILSGRFETRQTVMPGGMQSVGSTLFVSYVSGRLDVFNVRAETN